MLFHKVAVSKVLYETNYILLVIYCKKKSCNTPKKREPDQKNENNFVWPTLLYNSHTNKNNSCD